MKWTRIHWSAAALLILVSGCASVDLVSTKLQSARTIGIISAIADEFTLTPAGLTGIDSTDRTVAIASWGIDELVVSRIGAALSPRFQIQNVTYQRASFAHHEPASALPLIDRLREVPVKTIVRTEVSPQGLDAYVVVTTASSRYGSRGHIVSGLGVIDDRTVLARYAAIHALYTIWVIDGRSFEVIDKKSASPLDNAEIIRLSGPSRKIDPALLSIADVAASEQIKAALTELLTRSLDVTLRDLRLVGRS
jgi:hypothetical protein